MTRDDIELYVTGNYEGDIAALERAIADDPALAAMVAEEARLEVLLRDAAVAATFCAACHDVVRAERCDRCGAAVRPGGYTVERVLVANAHGRMYVAHDADGKQVALKELAFVHAPSPAAIAAFEREAKFLRALEHPAIPRFVASFEEGHGVHARYYLAQELVAGDALDRLDEHWYREDEIIALARQVLEILVYLQSLSPMVIHRDIKPANLLRRADGSIALVDFGAAYVQGTTAGSTTVGTFGYMPIEQLAGQVDATTDVYALGASLLHLLTRQEPWKLTHNQVTINVSAPLRAFLDKLVAPDPRARFASAKDALAALDRRDELVVRPRRPARRAPIFAIAAAVVLASSGFGVHALVSRSTGSPPAAAPVLSRLKIVLPDSVTRQLDLDGKTIASVTNGVEIPIAPGVHQTSLVAPNKARCEEQIMVAPGETRELECIAGVEFKLKSINPFEIKTSSSSGPDDDLPTGTNVDLEFKGASIHNVMRVLAAQCGLNLVIPDSIEARIDVQLANVPCNKAIEVLLESHMLWYRYDAETKLLRVAPRKELDADDSASTGRDETRGEHWVTDDVLPPGKLVDLDATRGSLRLVVGLITKGSGLAPNVVIPETIGEGKDTLGVTIHAMAVPWQTALQAVLAAHGLWYRYRDSGRIIVIGPRKQLDAEDAATVARTRGH